MAAFQPSIKRVKPLSRSESTLKHARALIKEKRFDEALQTFEFMLQQGESSPVIHMSIGRMKFHQRRHEEAIEHFQAAIQLSPTNALPYIRLARTYLAQGKLEYAEENFQNAIGLDQKSVISYASLGLIRSHQQKFQEATVQYEKALRFNPRFVPARLRLAYAYMRLQRETDAFSQVKAALRIEPKNYNVHKSLGDLHMAIRDYPNAQKSFETALELVPETNLALQMDLVDSLIANNDADRAEEVLSTISNRERFPVRYHCQWGDLYYQRGMYPEAVDEYRAAALVASETDNEIARIEASNTGTGNAEGDGKWQQIAESYREMVPRFREDHSDDLSAYAMEQPEELAEE